jgi:hypothetical protein
MAFLCVLSFAVYIVLKSDLLELSMQLCLNRRETSFIMDSVFRKTGYDELPKEF